MEKALRTFAALGLGCSVVLALSACERSGDAQPPANAPGSSQSAAPVSPAVSIDLSESDNGAALDVERGTTLVVRLPANASTGYSWSLVTSGSSVLSQGEPVFARDAAPDNRVGAGGTESWSFTAQQGGEQELRFEYRRAWEREVAPPKVVSYTIRVR